mmetsp:Transcript_46716/g.99949  ORF Transcript_46716/g.99949 Transcript_46716/m.99949 type:complete len:292 (+) Transcript_46716:362-1237(+)|eukprot:CAMPEP_0206494932 /NCGR_PEP_ID=MMETSP0324_2-20121206/48093_1 /ASSEMBLY_ACC=CAM_ASM_000836 /TAXON_ID=2866 /ORGANISM="Crypthecodinium cohnii, Strain Seligo" /LENGTH=291 /DNA_ID=CAMNT_0053978823 /DNA_START=265 /DNA_END=1140 /DNA_ORIENTATION=-
MASAILAEHKAHCLASCLGTDLDTIISGGLSSSSLRAPKGALHRPHDDVLVDRLYFGPPSSHRTSFAQFLGLAGNKVKHKHFLSSFDGKEEEEESGYAEGPFEYSEPCKDHKANTEKFKIAVCRGKETLSEKVLEELEKAKCTGALKQANVVMETHAFDPAFKGKPRDPELFKDGGGDGDDKPDLIVAFGDECKAPAKEDLKQHFLKIEEKNDAEIIMDQIKKKVQELRPSPEDSATTNDEENGEGGEHHEAADQTAETHKHKKKGNKVNEEEQNDENAKDNLEKEDDNSD